MDPYVQQNRSLDTDLLILRSLFALDPNTNLPISTNYILSTDGLGGLVWTDPLILGGISFPILQSTTIGLGTVGYVSTSKLDAVITSTSQGLGTLTYVSTAGLDTILQSTSQGIFDYAGASNYISSSQLASSLQSTVTGLGSVGYVSTPTLNLALRSTTANIFDPIRYISAGNLISTTSGLLNNTFFTTPNNESTIKGLGTIGYISTSGFISSLRSTVAGLGSAGYLSSAVLESTFGSAFPSTVEGLGTSGYVSTSFLNEAFVSTNIGLGTLRYVSESYMIAYVENALANSGTTNSNVSTSFLDAALRSTNNGLGTFGYVSSSQLVSTTAFFIDASRYVSTGALVSTTAGIIAGQTGTLTNASLTSTVAGLGSANYVSTTGLRTALVSTVTGLGSANYISSLSLQSTVAKLLDIANASTFITIDRAGTVNVYAPLTVNNVAGDIIYISTFLTSSVRYSGTNGTISGVVLPNPTTGTDLLFSTGIVPFAAFSSFINANSRISLDIFPTFAFTELNTMATRSLITPMSTFIQCANHRINSINTSFLIANSKTIGFSNHFQQQLKLNFLGSDITPCYTSSYILYHHLPNGMTINLDPGLKASSITVRYGSTNSMFVSVQNYA
jgi:hypothetical protein